MANDKFPLIVNPADVTGTALSKVVQLQPSDKLSPDALPTMVGDSGSGGTAGIVPAPAAGDAAAGKYLDADGTWTVPPGGGGGSGDVTGPGTSTAGNVPTWSDTTGGVLTDGFPVTAAAKTVLDDATAAAMVDTLGGASSTGTGGLVRAASPTLTTPALGTPSALILTNATGLPTAGVLDDAITYAKIQDVSATDRLLGRVSASSGIVEEVVCTDLAQSLLDDATQGAMQTTLGVDPAGTDNSTPVTLAGSLDYLTLSGQQITRGPIDLAADVTGVLPHGNLGTGGGGATKFLREDSTFQEIPGGGDALTSGTLAQFAATTSAELRGVLSDETGTGAAVFATSPTLVTPLLGTPTSGTLTNCEGLPTGGVTVSATDRLLGRVSASGGVAEEIPITDFVQTILDDADAAAVRTTIGAGTGNGDALTSGHLGQFAATTSAQLAGVLSDETGSGAAVFATSPTLVTPALGTPSAVVLTNATGLPTAGLVDGAVTDAKLADMSGFAVKAKPTTGTGDPSEVVLGASDLLGRIDSGDVQGITVGDLTEEGTPAAGDFLVGWESGGGLRKFDIGDLPAGTPADDSITNAKLANMTAQAIKANPTGSSADPQDLAIAEARIVGRLTGGNVAGLTAAEVVTLTGAEVTSNKNVASGYAGLDALIQVPTARQRPREWDQIEYGWRKTPGLGLVEPRGVGFPYMFDGELTDAPGNGGSWVLVDSGASTHGGLQTAFDVIQTRWSPDLNFLIKTGASLTGHRFWVGVSAAYIDSTAPVADGGTFSIASACFTWDATVHSASNFWRAHTSDGSGAAGATVTTTGTAIAVDTEYDLRIKFNPGTNVLFYINDSLVATHTTDLPSVSTLYGIVMRVVGTDKTFLFKRAVVLHD